jgi:putative ABC transport system permease protein
MSLADRVYGVLLGAYPASFRARFETGMRDTFVRDHGRARDRGRRAIVAFWATTVTQALWFGLAERASRRDRLSAPIPATRGTLMTLLSFDWRDAVRSLRASPVVTTIAVLSLALGIGANTALFSILNSLVLKMLPVREPEQLALLASGSWTNPIWEQIRDRQGDLFDGAFAWSPVRFNVSDRGETEFVSGAYASGGLFEVLGVRALIGRTLTERDDVRGGGPDGAVAVISYGLWQRRFGGVADVIGRPLALEHVSFTIVGVAPPRFFGPDVGRTCDVFVPLADEALIRGHESSLEGHWTWWLDVMARLKPGQTLEEATARLRGAQPQIRAASLPDSGPADARRGYLSEPFALVPAATGRSELRGAYEQPLKIILVVVGAVLLIACANIANLLLARATARRHELVVRLALGASRARLAQQLLLESLILAVAGAALGLLVARIGCVLLVKQLAGQVFLDTSLDWRVLAFTAGVTVLTALLFGLAPAFGVTRIAPNEALKAQGRGLTGDRRFGLRNTLVVAQVALSLALVVAAGLFVRTLASLMDVPLGFNPTALVAVDLNVHQNPTPPDQRAALFERFREAAQSAAVVKSAAISLLQPLSGAGWNTRIAIPGGALLSDRQRMSWVNAVTPGWFATYEIRIVAGRDFSADDREAAPKVTLVNEAFARKFFNGQNPVGRDFHGSIGTPTDESYRVIGLVADAMYRRPRDGVVPTLYLALTQIGRLSTSATLSAHLVSDSASARRALASALGQVDPTVALTFRSFDDEIRRSVAQERLVALLSSFFGALAIGLAALGLYGVTLYGVRRRRTEIGVRMALGANPAAVVRLVLRRVGWLVGVGIVAGAALSWWAARFVAASLLYGLQARNLSTFALAAAVLGTIGTLAGWLPAHRAARVDPTEVLREG